MNDHETPPGDDQADDRDVWRVYLDDGYGFVLHDPETLLAHIDQPDWIAREYGDCIPERIVVARRSAAPAPQYEGSDVLRAPGSYYAEDHHEWDIHYEEPQRALDIWRGAHGFAAALNQHAHLSEQPPATTGD